MKIITVKKLYLGFLFTTYILCFAYPANACTGFGAITGNGTIIGKNRDYYYVPQKFALVMPIPRFFNWFANTYHHNNQFYALTSAESVSMGVNQNGLTAIEEDSLSPAKYPRDAKEYKMIQQQEGMPDGMVLYGILQNFNTVDEMIPYLSKIFCDAAPDFYQFADTKKILTVEVAYGKSNNGLKHKFTYQVLSKKNDYFTHTNTYLSPEFTSLNSLISNQDSLNSSLNRFKIITNLISKSSVRNISTASQWFMNTQSKASSGTKPNECLNTSLFRSDLQGYKSINMLSPNDKIFGTVASMIVSNHGNFKNSYIYLMMIDSITIQNNGKQLIKYNELYTTLEKLFSGSKPKFVEHEFERSLPINGICI